MCGIIKKRVSFLYEKEQLIDFDNDSLAYAQGEFMAEVFEDIDRGGEKIKTIMKGYICEDCGLNGNTIKDITEWEDDDK